MKHITLVSCSKARPGAAHTSEEIAKFLTGMLEILGSVVGILTNIETLRDLKEGTAS